MLDAASQAALALMSSNTTEKDNSTLLPFSLEELVVFQPLQKKMWAWVRMADSGLPSSNSVMLNIDLCNENGEISIRFKGLSVRKTVNASIEQKHSETASPESQFLVPVWDAFTPVRIDNYPESSSQVLIVSNGNVFAKTLLEYYPHALVLDQNVFHSRENLTNTFLNTPTINHIFWLAPSEKMNANMIQAQQEGVFQVFRLIKSILQCGYGTKDLGWSIITYNTVTVEARNKIDPTHASIHGLIGSMSKRIPKLEYSFIGYR